MTFPLSLLSGKILQAEAVMRDMPQAEGLVTRHYFADGMYARELFRPAGTVIIGKVHKREHFYIVTKGAVKVVMDDKAVEYRAPAVIVSQPGTKRAVYAIEDSVCMTVHRLKRRSTRDLARIERELVQEDKLARFDALNEVKPKQLEAV